jgi:hypothetical protein
MLASFYSLMLFSRECRLPIDYSVLRLNSRLMVDLFLSGHDQSQIAKVLAFIRA